MNTFLVDVNLPKNFSFFNHPNFVFVVDINLQMSDTKIWNYAIENELIIVTKDVDFYSKFLLEVKSPKVVYFKIGNFSLKELYNYFLLNWANIETEITTTNFIIASEDYIKSIY